MTANTQFEAPTVMRSLLPEDHGMPMIEGAPPPTVRSFEEELSEAQYLGKEHGKSDKAKGLKQKTTAPGDVDPDEKAMSDADPEDWLDKYRDADDKQKHACKESHVVEWVENYPHDIDLLTEDQQITVLCEFTESLLTEMETMRAANWELSQELEALKHAANFESKFFDFTRGLTMEQRSRLKHAIVSNGVEHLDASEWEDLASKVLGRVRKIYPGLAECYSHRGDPLGDIFDEEANTHKVRPMTKEMASYVNAIKSTERK
jgi:hypothetical protein